MDGDTLVNIGFVVLFVLIGGVFAGTEMAIISLREGQIRQIEASGARGRRIGTLVRNPNRFLSSVQVGVTLAGFLSSAYGGATIAPHVAPLFVAWGLPATVASTVALVAMTLLIAYLSLVLGELVPKRLAMQHPAAFTRILAPPLNAFSVIMRPVVWLLSVSTNGVLRMLGQDPAATAESLSSEEVQDLVSRHSGLRPYSRRILLDVFRSTDRRLGEVMRPRPEVQFMRGDLTIAEAQARAGSLPHSRFPVIGESVDDVLGFIHVRDLMAATSAGRDDERLADIVRPMLPLPSTNKVVQSLSIMRSEKQQIALVVDEYGGTDGIVAMEDLLEELVGEIYDEYDLTSDPEDSTLRRGETLLVDGRLIVGEFESLVDTELPDGPYDTVAGLVVDQLGRLAEVGDVVEVAGLRLEVVTVRNLRIDRIRVTRAGEPHPAAG